MEALQHRLPGWSLVGVDPSPTSSEQARARGLDVRKGFLHTVELDGQFDLIVVMGNFQLHPDPADTLRRLAELAAPGASLFLDSKNPRSCTRLLAARFVTIPAIKRINAVHAFAAHALHGLRHAPTKGQLATMLHESGWRVDEMRTTGPRLLRFRNQHALAQGIKGRAWALLDKVDARADERAWIQVRATRK